MQNKEYQIKKKKNEVNIYEKKVLFINFSIQNTRWCKETLQKETIVREIEVTRESKERNREKHPHTLTHIQEMWLFLVWNSF